MSSGGIAKTTNMDRAAGGKRRGAMGIKLVLLDSMDAIIGIEYESKSTLTGLLLIHRLERVSWSITGQAKGVVHVDNPKSRSLIPSSESWMLFDS